jgi:hypothetical protein
LPLPDWKASLRGLETARQRAAELKEATVAAQEKHVEAEGRWVKHFTVCSLRQAQFTLKAKDFEVATTHIPDLESTLDAALLEMREIESQVQPFSDAVAGRIAAALQLLNHGDLPLAALEPLKAESAGLVPVLSGLSDTLRNLHAIRRRFPAFDMLLQNRGNHQDAAKVDVVIAALTKALKGDLDAIHARLKDVAYPFAHASGRITVSQYAHGKGNYEHELEAVYAEGQAATDRLYSLYYRVAGRLASIAELIEERVAEISGTTAPSEAPDQTR